MSEKIQIHVLIHVPIRVQIFFSIFVNFGRVFSQTALDSCFFREALLKKINTFFYYCTFRKIRAGRFSSWDKIFISKILFWLCRDPALNKWDLDESRGKQKFTKDECSSLISLIVPSRLLFYPGLHVNILLVLNYMFFLNQLMNESTKIKYLICIHILGAW